MANLLQSRTGKKFNAGQFSRKLTPELRGLLQGIQISGRSEELDNASLDIIAKKKKPSRKQRTKLRFHGKYGDEIISYGKKEDRKTKNIKKVRKQTRDRKRDAKVKKIKMTKREKETLKNKKKKKRIEARFLCKIPSGKYASGENTIRHTMSSIPTNAETNRGISSVATKIHNRVFRDHAIITIESIEVKE